MAQKSDFSEQEWEQLRKGATGAGLLVSVSDRSFFDSFKEAGSLAKHLASGKSGESELVRELAGERASGFGARSSAEELESETLEALRGAMSVAAGEGARRGRGLQGVRARARRPGRSGGRRRRRRRGGDDREDQGRARLKQSTVWSSTRPADCMNA